MRSPTVALLLIFSCFVTIAGAEDYGIELPIEASAGTGPVMDVATVGGYAYAIGDGALRVVDIADPSRPHILGSLSGLGSVRQVEVYDGIAYVTSRQDGLFIVDVRDSANPKLLNHYDTVEFATGVVLSGEVLFVACRNFGVELIDVSDPTNPSHISLVRTGEAQSVVVRDGYLYAGVWASSEVVVVDVKDPWQPRITARAKLDGYGDGVDVEGDYLYVTTGHHSGEQPRKNPGDPGFGRGHGLEVFDLTDPAQPKYISRVKFPPLYIIGNDMWDVTVANGHAFVADTWNGLFVVDVRDANDLKVVAHAKPPKPENRKGPGFVGGLALTDGYILMAGGYTDLHLVPATMAEPPIEEDDQAPVIGPARLATEDVREGWQVYRPRSQVYGVDFLSDDVAVVACGSGGIHVVALRPEINLLAEFPTSGFAIDVSVSGGRVFVAESAGGLSIWEPKVDGGYELEKIGGFELKGGKAIRQVETPGEGDRILIQAGATQFYILDVSDPSNPKPLLKDTRHGLLYGDQMMRGLVEGRYAAIHWHVSGTHWYDLLAEPLPVYSGDNFGQRIGSKNGLIALGDQTLATLRGGYVLLDRSERRSIKELEIYPIGKLRANPGVPNISGNRLYTADRSTGLVTISDLSDPKKPRLIEQFVTSGNPCRVEVRKGLIAIPNGYPGLLVKDR